jgi:hypothetical protein
LQRPEGVGQGRAECSAGFGGGLGKILAAPGGPLYPGFVSQVLLACQASRQQFQQVVGQAQEVGLRALGLRAAGPCLAFLELVFELVENFFQFPPASVEPGDESGGQIKTGGDELQWFALAALTGGGLVARKRSFGDLLDRRSQCRGVVGVW